MEKKTHQWKHMIQNMNNKPRVGVIIVGYNAASYIHPLFLSISKINTNKCVPEIIYVDNASPDDSNKRVEEGRSIIKFPLHLIFSEKNLGFAGGNNKGIEFCKKNNFDYVFLLNQDTEIDSNAIDCIIETAEKLNKKRIIQSLLIEYGTNRIVNSAGNLATFYGIGYAGAEGVSESEIDWKHHKYTYCSGAAVCIPINIISEIGMFRDFYFMYHEDLEFCMRAIIAGYDVYVEPESIVYHKYSFSGSVGLINYMERNRYIFLFTYFDLWMLFFIFPVLFAFEVGTLGYSIIHGWFPKKMLVYKQLFSVEVWKNIRHDKAHIRSVWKIYRSDFYKRFVCDVKSEKVKNFLLYYIVNPCLCVYWTCIRFIHGLIR